ncbi:transcriptional regulatory protein AlgP-like [Coturnix japonica]|uniref:transcriptional regulatory protein AlgP-like n=1 Tax=Coturnix japonica TaxID=93934 RepID=UPI0013A5C379|nr:transcriptional regulatory protein AlgP-like [Coturnix japonica]XP_032298936.1 transcriptional regulatory protein AlgP-like [Coturnix japonica]XP_032298937.1 transcriptional regulatory protein AlgP-like [Coturnix japonica]
MADIKPRLAASFSQPQRHSHSHTASRSARAQRRPGERARGAGTAARAREPGESKESKESGRAAPGHNARTGTQCRHQEPPLLATRRDGRYPSAALGRRWPLPPEGKPAACPDRPAARPGTLGTRAGTARPAPLLSAAGAARPEASLPHLPLMPALGPPVRLRARRPNQRPLRRPRGPTTGRGGAAPRAPRQRCPHLGTTRPLSTELVRNAVAAATRGAAGGSSL